MKSRGCLVVLAILSTRLWGQAPRPFLQEPIPDGATSIQGYYNPLPQGTAPALQLCDGSDLSTCVIILADFSVNLPRGLFTVQPDKPLSAKQKIRVLLTAGTSTMSSDVYTVKDKDEPEALVLRSIEATYGSSKVFVNFVATQKTSPAPKLHLRFGTESHPTLDQTYTPKDDELKAGRAELNLTEALLGGGEVTVEAIPAGAADSKKSVKPRPASIQLTAKPLREGDNTISGTAATSVQKICVAVIGASFESPDVLSGRNADESLYPCDGARRHVQSQTFQAFVRSQGLDSSSYDMVSAASGPLLEEKNATPDSKSGAFTITLDRPLNSGSKVFIREIFSTPGGDRVSFEGPEAVVVEPSGIDFGRARFFLTVGAALSQSDNSFGNADPYIAFTGDGTFFNDLVKRRRPQRMKDPNDPSEAAGLFDTQVFGVSLHWTTAVRLTQTGTVSAIGTAPTLQSAQSGVFQVGMYLPMRFRGMDWIYRGTQYSAYFAPIVKGGVTSVKDGIPVKKVSTTVETSAANCPIADCSYLNQTTSPDPVITKSAGPAPFFGYGMRLGVMQYGLLGKTLRNRQISPDPVTYIDFLFGQNDAYVTPGTSTTNVNTTTANGIQTKTTTVTQGYTYETRTMIEARTKFPYLPAELGVDVNYNFHAPVRSTLTGAKDMVNLTDFRFLIGFRFDVSKAISTILAPKK